jgi:hypothetical protein
VLHAVAGDVEERVGRCLLRYMNAVADEIENDRRVPETTAPERIASRIVGIAEVIAKSGVSGVTRNANAAGVPAAAGAVPRAATTLAWRIIAGI